MSDLTQTLQAILHDPLKTAGTVGYVGLDIPADVLEAAGATHLPWDADRDTPFADKMMETGFAPWAKSILEDWAEGRFDRFDRVVFSRGSDDAQRLYYYLCELRRRGEVRGPEPIIFDVARIRRASSLERSEEAIRTLVSELGLTQEVLAAAIAKVNLRRAAFDRLQADRSGDGPLYEQISRASIFANIDEVIKGFTASTVTNGRVLLSGTPPPDDRLHRAVETTGFSIIAEEHERGLNRLGAPVGGGDPLKAIAAQFYDLSLPPRSYADRAARLVEAAKAARAKAVIVWLIEEEEALVWSVPGQKAALSEAGIPALFLTRRRWNGGDGVGKDISEFLEGVRA